MNLSLTYVSKLLRQSASNFFNLLSIIQECLTKYLLFHLVKQLGLGESLIKIVLFNSIRPLAPTLF